MPQQYIVQYSEYDLPLKAFKFLYSHLERFQRLTAEEKRSEINNLIAEMSGQYTKNIPQIETYIGRINVLENQLNEKFSEYISAQMRAKYYTLYPVPKYKGLFFRNTAKDPLKLAMQEEDEAYGAIENLNQQITRLKIKVVEFYPILIPLCDRADIYFNYKVTQSLSSIVKRV